MNPSAPAPARADTRMLLIATSLDIHEPIIRAQASPDPDQFRPGGLRERLPRPQACHAYRLEHGEVAKHTYDLERARNPTVDAPMRRLARDVAAAKHDCAGCRHARRFTHVM